jgi:hypothetical protein
MLLVLDQVLAAGGGKQRCVVSLKLRGRHGLKQCKLSCFCDGNICAYHLFDGAHSSFELLLEVADMCFWSSSM